MICSALQWLVDRKKLESVENNGKEKLSEGNDDDEPDWLRNFTLNKEADVVENKNIVHKRKNGSHLKEKGENVRDLSSYSSEEGEKGKGSNKEERSVKGEGGVNEVDVEEFLLEEYDSGSEIGGKSKRKNVGRDDMFSSEEEDEVDELDGKEEESRMKIYFCSRTHSQLSQFMKELRKTKFASELKVVCLGSRKNLCINEGMIMY